MSATELATVPSKLAYRHNHGQLGQPHRGIDQLVGAAVGVRGDDEFGERALLGGIGEGPQVDPARDHPVLHVVHRSPPSSTSP